MTLQSYPDIIMCSTVHSHDHPEPITYDIIMFPAYIISLALAIDQLIDESIAC